MLRHLRAYSNGYLMPFVLHRVSNSYVVTGCYAGAEVVRRQSGKWAFTSSVKSMPRPNFTNISPKRETYGCLIRSIHVTSN